MKFSEMRGISWVITHLTRSPCTSADHISLLVIVSRVPGLSVPQSAGDNPPSLHPVRPSPLLPSPMAVPLLSSTLLPSPSSPLAFLPLPSLIGLSFPAAKRRPLKWGSGYNPGKFFYDCVREFYAILRHEFFHCDCFVSENFQILLFPYPVMIISFIYSLRFFLGHQHAHLPHSHSYPPLGLCKHLHIKRKYEVVATFSVKGLSIKDVRKEG